MDYTAKASSLEINIVGSVFYTNPLDIVLSGSPGQPALMITGTTSASLAWVMEE